MAIWMMSGLWIDSRELRILAIAYSALYNEPIRVGKPVGWAYPAAGDFQSASCGFSIRSGRISVENSNVFDSKPPDTYVLGAILDPLDAYVCAKYHRDEPS